MLVHCTCIWRGVEGKVRIPEILLLVFIIPFCCISMLIPTTCTKCICTLYVHIHTVPMNACTYTIHWLGQLHCSVELSTTPPGVLNSEVMLHEITSKMQKYAVVVSDEKCPMLNNSFTLSCHSNHYHWPHTYMYQWGWW